MIFAKNKKESTTFQRYTGFTLSFKSTHSALRGFTLAEVLLTLAIIGVVGALTIPGFIAEHQKQVYVTGLKKAYSTGNLALQKIAFEKCGTSDISCIFPDTPNITTIGDTISAEYNVAKNCKTSTSGVCYRKQFMDYPDGDPDYVLVSGSYRFLTTDSTLVSISTLHPNCDLDASLSEDSPTKKICANISIDVNGSKGPNRNGRDTFSFYITSNKGVMLYPQYGKEDNPACSTCTEDTGGNNWWNYSNRDYCGTNSNKRGYFCAARVMEEGWEMDY